MRDASATPNLTRHDAAPRVFAAHPTGAHHHLLQPGADDEQFLPPSPPARSQPEPEPLLAQPANDEPMWWDSPEATPVDRRQAEQRQQPTRREWSWDAPTDDGSLRATARAYPAGHAGTPTDRPTESNFLSPPRAYAAPFRSPSPMELQLSLSPQPLAQLSPAHASRGGHRPTASFLSLDQLGLDSQPTRHPHQSGHLADIRLSSDEMFATSQQRLFGSPTSALLPPSAPTRHRPTDSLNLSGHQPPPAAPTSRSMSDDDTASRLFSAPRTQWKPPQPSSPSASNTVSFHSPPLSCARGTDVARQAAELPPRGCGAPLAASFTFTSGRATVTSSSEDEAFLPMSPPSASHSAAGTTRRTPTSPSASFHSASMTQWNPKTDAPPLLSPWSATFLQAPHAHVPSANNTVSFDSSPVRAAPAATTGAPHKAAAAPTWCSPIFIASAASQPHPFPVERAPSPLRPPRTVAAPLCPLSFLQASELHTWSCTTPVAVEEVAPLSPHALLGASGTDGGVDRGASLAEKSDEGGCAASTSHAHPTSGISHVGLHVVPGGSVTSTQHLLACLGDTASPRAVDASADEDMMLTQMCPSPACTEKTTVIGAAHEVDTAVHSVPPFNTTAMAESALGCTSPTPPPTSLPAATTRVPTPSLSAPVSSDVAGSSKRPQATPQPPAKLSISNPTPTSRTQCELAPSPDYTPHSPNRAAASPNTLPAAAPASPQGSRRAQMLVRTAQAQYSKERVEAEDGTTAAAATAVEKEGFLQMENTALVALFYLQLHTSLAPPCPLWPA
jgi:hypothetical protein